MFQLRKICHRSQVCPTACDSVNSRWSQVEREDHQSHSWIECLPAPVSVHCVWSAKEIRRSHQSLCSWKWMVVSHNVSAGKQVRDLCKSRSSSVEECLPLSSPNFRLLQKDFPHKSLHPFVVDFICIFLIARDVEYFSILLSIIYGYACLSLPSAVVTGM